MQLVYLNEPLPASFFLKFSLFQTTNSKKCSINIADELIRTLHLKMCLRNLNGLTRHSACQFDTRGHYINEN